MPLRAHLVELRHRLFLAVLGLLVGAVIGWFLYTPVFEALQQPVNDVAAERGELITLNFAGLATALDMQVKVAFFLGVLISSPWWIYQLWAFVTPGLTRKERGYAYAFVGAAVPLFLAGAALAWWALPNAVRLLIDFTPQGATNITDAQTYLSFVMRLVLAFGLAFLLPVLMVALNFAGLVSAGAWRRGWRWAILVAFVFAAVMTPTPDAITMIMVALPICGLYFVALGVCALHDRRVNKRRLAEGLPTLDGYLPDEATGETA
ncbi:twin-arginine translocase subunit TatC [Cellulomonas sp. URHE0023]|uniref:twin-arginine translocase subunit TatC n=1 Tax=Cellulomonas sp. URHE0023 TaxID=1380354 RepID=UPI000484E43B|nr:twin-arginine translocase subunit TatC [Cellulomonas sp. URHE0023]